MTKKSFRKTWEHLRIQSSGTKRIRTGCFRKTENGLTKSVRNGNRQKIPKSKKFRYISEIRKLNQSANNNYFLIRHNPQRTFRLFIPLRWPQKRMSKKLSKSPRTILNSGDIPLCRNGTNCFQEQH